MKIIKLPLLKEEFKKRKVAAYTRVSVSSDSLLHSLANQVSHYTEMIQKNPEWEFVQVYVDEGVTGTSTESREQFLKMMDDARAGRFDLLLTKSVSRFARNTVDLLESCRELKSLNVEVRFEKDRISTFNSDGELVLSLLASYAQAESESISQNVKWGKTKQMQDGVYHHFTRCYGYDWDGDIYEIVEEEAEVVRFIYKAYLDGMSPKKISELITAKTVTGKNFTRGTVKDILKNRIYIGDRVLQQFYSPRVRKCNRNYGEVPKYILPEVHEPIIAREMFDEVQNVMQQKAKDTPKKTFTCFSGRLKCGHCERALCRRTLHGKKIWKCQGNEISKTCQARYITEEKLKEYTFSIFEDENEFKMRVDHIKVYDDYLEYIFKDDTMKTIERKEPKTKMQTRKVVTVIPEKKQDIIQEDSAELKKKKVAGYARVSTELDEQQNSYNSQLDYYTNYINSRSDWEFAGMYSDEGITGTSIKKREGFTSMIQDALDGKIDMIVTKSISRFARNTVDTLSTVRKLKNAGIEVFFEKENIYTLDSKGELLLTILSSLAQEESRSISENTTWGQRKRMADGHGCLGFSRFLGYDRGPNGEFVINEEQAKIVKRIYYEYLDGKSSAEIARRLTADGIKTVTGKDRWDTSTIISILKNEKYKGDCLMQKYYINDYLEKKLIKNKGELQQYYVENHHVPIVSAEVFDRVQMMMKSKRRKKRVSAARDFSSMIICGDCGECYGSKVWHSNSKYKKIIYRCNAKYNGEKKCNTPAIDEERLKEIFVEAINILLIDKDEIIDNINCLLDIKKQCKTYADEIRQAAVKVENIEQVYRKIINDQKSNPLPFEEYEMLIKKYGHEYDNARESYNALIEDNNLHEREVCKLEEFIHQFEHCDKIVLEYDYDLMKRTTESIVVNTGGTITINFIGEQNITLKI